MLDALGIDTFCTVGESLGGGVGVVVDQLRPGVMRHLVLCEGIAFDAHAFPRGEAPGEGGSGNYMADIARARRAVWPDREAVRDPVRGSRRRSTSSRPEALDAYLRWGFFDRADGQVELACAPETEAAIFEVTVGVGRRGGGVRPPRRNGRAGVVLHGDASYLPEPWFQAQADAGGRAVADDPGRPLLPPGGHRTR